MHCTAVTRQRPVHDQASGLSLLKASKGFTWQRPVCSRHRDLCSLKTFKNFTHRILYEMTNHLLQQVESQCLSECRKTRKQVDIRQAIMPNLSPWKAQKINSGAFSRDFSSLRHAAPAPTLASPSAWQASPSSSVTSPTSPPPKHLF
jgi:hypothetical protein